MMFSTRSCSTSIRCRSHTNISPLTIPIARKARRIHVYMDSFLCGFIIPPMVRQDVHTHEFLHVPFLPDPKRLELESH